MPYLWFELRWCCWLRCLVGPRRWCCWMRPRREVAAGHYSGPGHCCCCCCCCWPTQTLRLLQQLQPLEQLWRRRRCCCRQLTRTTHRYRRCSRHHPAKRGTILRGSTIITAIIRKLLNYNRLILIFNVIWLVNHKYSTFQGYREVRRIYKLHNICKDNIS